MSQQIIDTGGEAGAGGGDDLFTAFTKINDNFTEIYSGNVTAANLRVYSVAGRIGNVVLTAQDVFGAATYGNIAVLQQNINAAIVTAQNYTDASIGNLGPLSNVEITGGKITANLTGSWGTLVNLAVSGNQTIGGQLSVTQGASIGGALVLGDQLVFDDSTVQTTAFQGFGNIFSNALAQSQAIAAISANLDAVNTFANSLIGNLSIVDTTIYVNNAGAEITLQPDGTANVIIGQSGANDLVLGKGIWFDDGTYQDTAYTPGEYVTDAELSSNVTALGQRIDAANAAIATNTNRVAAANAQISSLTSTVSAQALSDAANVAAANAHITSNDSKISAANLAIASTNANLAAANAHITTLLGDVSSLQSDVSTLQTDLSNAVADFTANDAAQGAAIVSLQNSRNSTNANVAAANSAIASLQSASSSTNANVAAANAVIASNTADIVSLNSDVAGLVIDVGNAQDGLDLANAAISSLESSRTSTNANVAAANSAIATAQSNISSLQGNAAVQAVAIDAINANLVAANAAVLSVSSRVSAANLEIGKLRANLTAANAQISTNTSDIANLSGDVSGLLIDVASLQDGLDAANATIINNADVYTDLSDAANVAIDNLRANVIAANAVISGVQDGLDAANVAIAALGAFDPAEINANVAAANATIAFQGARITTSNVLIGELRANLTASNARIATLESGLASVNANLVAANSAIAALGGANLTLMNANIAAANVEIDHLRANLAASNVRIGRLESNITIGMYANAALVVTNDNLAGANAAIAALSVDIATLYSNAATQYASIFTLQANALSQQNQIDAKAPLSNPVFTGTLDVVGDITTTGNVDAVYVNGSVASFSDYYGELKTNAQPFVTSLGTLTGLTVGGNISALGISSSQGFTGQIKTANQPLITGLGTLTGLNVAGSANITGALGISTIIADVSVSTPLVVATTLGGTLTTTAQPFVTSLGNLVSLAVDGTSNLNDIIVAGNITANAARSQLAVNSLSTNSIIAATANISTYANIETVYGNSAAFAMDVSANNLITAYDITAARVMATGVAGTLETAAQPNITSVGTLTALAITGNTDISANANVSGNVAANWVLANVYGRTATFAGNVTTGNLSAAFITGVLKTAYQPNINELGNLLYLNVDGDTTITGNLAINSQYGLLAATQGAFTIVDGYLTNPTQPNVTTLGTLTGLSVAGTVNVTGDQYISQDLWILGNMYVNGNTTTVSAGNVTTNDKDLTLANNAISSAAARGAGIYIGDGGIYGNLSIYDGVWATPNDFAIGGNLSAPTAAFTSVTGTLQTAAQPNITSVGTLSGLTVAGTSSTANLSVTYTGTFANIITGNVLTTTINADQGDFITLNVGNDVNLGGLLTVANISFPDGTYQNTTANSAVAANLALINANIIAANLEISSLQANIAAANTAISTNTGDISTLYANAGTQQTEINSLGANITAANSAISTNAGDIVTLYSNAASQQTEINSLGANIAAANLEIASTNANVAAANAIISVLNSVNLGGDPVFAGNVTVGSLLSRGNIESGGPYATGNTIIWNDSGNATITTNSANLYINNYNAGTYATPFLGNVVVDANLLVNANTTIRANLYAQNLYTGDIIGSYIAGTLTTATQTNITQVGTLIDLAVTGNVSTGNVSGTKGTFTELEGTLLTASQTNITQVGNLVSLNVDTDIITSNLSVGNLSVAGSFALTAGSLNLQGDITTTTNLVVGGNTSLANANIAGDLSAGGNLYIGGVSTVVGNITTLAQGIRNANSVLDNNLYTGFVTATGNLSVTGNASTASLSTGPIDGLTLNVTGGTPATDPTTGALTVAGGAGIGGALWTGGNANVGGSVRTTNLIAEGPSYFKNQVNINTPIIESDQLGIAMFNSAQIDTIVFGTSAVEIRIGDENPIGPGQGNVLVRNNLDVSGNAFANGNSIVRATTESTGQYTGALQVFGGAWIGANVYTSGNVDVTGTAKFNNTMFIGGNTTIAANTNITGTTTIAGNIRTTGSNLLVSANTSIVGNTSIIGNVTIVAPLLNTGNTVTIGGNVALNQNLHVSETVYANSLIVAGGIGIPNIDNTPIGQVTPARGTFTTLGSYIWQQMRPRPNQRPRMLLDFANNQNLDPRIVFVRNSVGTYFDNSANLVVAAAHQARFDHDPVTNTALGLLIEESRTNYLKYSSNFTNTSYWGPLGSTLSTTSATDSPTGTYNEAVAITEDTNNVIHGVYPDSSNNQITATVTNYYVASAFVKSGLRTQFGIIFENEGTGPIFDLVTGTVLQEGTAPGGFTTTSAMKQLANGWFRISTVLYKQTVSGNLVFALAEAGAVTYTGNSSVVGGYIYGAQLEEGSFATSYIPTTTAAVTRAADDVSITGSEFNSFYSSNEGMLLVDSVIEHAPSNKTGAINGVTPVTSTIRPTFLSIEGASTANRIALLAENITVPVPTRFGNLVIYKDNYLQGNLGTNDTHFITSSLGRMAVYFKANSIGATTNGNLAVTTTSGFIPDGLNTMYIGKGTASGYLNGTIAKISYYAKTSVSSPQTDEIRALTEQ